MVWVFLVQLLTAALFLVVGVSGEGQLGSCAALANAGDCEFYRCLDELLGGCGSGEYPLGFGYKYCKRFQDSKDVFDKKGQSWIDRVRLCLMNEIMEGVYLSAPPSPPSCISVAMVAFDSHPDCYLKEGVCSSVVADCDNFLNVVSILEFSDLLVSRRVGFRIAAKQEEHGPVSIAVLDFIRTSGDTIPSAAIHNLLGSVLSTV